MKGKNTRQGSGQRFRVGQDRAHDFDDAINDEDGAETIQQTAAGEIKEFFQVFKGIREWFCIFG